MISEKLSFGIDLGIGSCGWAVIQDPYNSPTPSIDALGSWMFDVPETDKERTPTNQIRRANRLLRRVIRRRRQRMSRLRHLLAQHKLIADSTPQSLIAEKLDPWDMRAKGLDHTLSPQEFAVAIAHIAKHRGFKSSAKNKSANAVDEDSKMLKEIAANSELLAQYRTIGEMFARDPKYQERRRNRDGDYSRSVQRADLEAEICLLFKRQRELGQGFASAKLEQDFYDIAFFQRDVQDSARMVGFCLFEPDQKRGAKLAPSFEMFRFLTRLINLRWRDENGERPLTPDEIAKAAKDAGKTAKVTTKSVRQAIGLSPTGRFTAIKPEDEGNDIAARTGEAFGGTASLRKALGEDLWAELIRTPEKLDDMAFVLSFFENVTTILAESQKLNLSDDILLALQKGLEKGSFAKFKGAAHISAKSVRKLLPHLLQGLGYDKACESVGYNHSESMLGKVEQVTDRKGFLELLTLLQNSIPNPIARKALTEALKQLWAMRNAYKLPGRIHIELARDVGNSLEERQKIEKGIEDRTKAKEKLREFLKTELNLTEISGEDLLRYELWKEQGGRCLYSNQEIHLPQVIATDNSVQVDHILPWSRFGDNSFHNKTLCTAQANQQKKGRTPFEWFTADKSPDEWDRYIQEVETLKSLKGMKKRNYLLKNAQEVEEKFRSRNLNDTRYACRIFAEAAKLLYPKGEGVRRVFTRPGRLTSELRRIWGLESLKKQNGKRLSNDRHHALDALVVAAVGEGAIQALTKAIQAKEDLGGARGLRQVDYPWQDFRAAAITALDKVFVARAERRRARGEGHAATIRQIIERDNQTFVTERKAIDKLTLKDLERIKDPERNTEIVKSVQKWIEAGKPKDDLPHSKQGHPIRKIRLLTTTKPSVPVRGGTADRGEMVRVDVFTKANKKGKTEFFLVPIYPHQVMNQAEYPVPPNRAVVAYKNEEDWTLVDHDFSFKFSIFPRSFVRVVKPSGECIEGYFCGLNRSTGAINLFEHNLPDKIQQGIGVKTANSLQKFSVDRLGNLSEITQEVRTWHGAACISANPPD